MPEGAGFLCIAVMSDEKRVRVFVVAVYLWSWCGACDSLGICMCMEFAVGLYGSLFFNSLLDWLVLTSRDLVSHDRVFPAVDIRSVFSCGLNLGYFNVYVAVGLLSAFNLRYLDGTPAVAARVSSLFHEAEVSNWPISTVTGASGTVYWQMDF